ncbi:MAG: helix-turn-helix transcriptional regulator [Brevibacterium aurantiacum]|uniref:helix-turn-helix transcriptional regulator n=1 Tax=Brevibacterium aurantiacum TaxID=273384 RepID=UPI001F0A998F|nr:helix-turn-helix transcriptional regulator [Brevibacterium aurantiacum]
MAHVIPPADDEGYARFRRILSLLDDPTIISLGELALRADISERSLQRLFQDHCGVGVKQILVRARIRDAIAALDRGWDGAFGDLAAELGWFDQSHFTADFHRVTGYTPSEYLSAYERSVQSKQ